MSRTNPTTPTMVYIIGEPGSDVLKIGISSDPARRLRDVRISNPYDVKVLWERSVEHARRVERNVHLALVGVRIRGEWFRVSLAEAIEVIERTVTKEPVERMRQEWQDAWQARLDRQVADLTVEPPETVKRSRFPRV